MSLRTKKIDYTQLISELLDILDIIYHNKQKKVSSSKLLQIIYDICTARYQSYYSELFSALVDFYQKFCDGVRMKLLSQQNELLQLYSQQFELYSLYSISINNYFNYFNDAICPEEPNYIDAYQVEDNLIQHPKYSKQTVLSLAYTIWKDNVIYAMKEEDQQIFKRHIQFHINKDRNGGMMDIKMLRNVIHSFVELNTFVNNKMETNLSLYQSEFEIDFLEELNRFYNNEANSLIQQLSIPKYLSKVESRIKQEVRRNELLLHSTSLNKSLEAIQTQLLKNHKQSIYKDFEIMIENESYDDCHRMYNLMNSFKEGILPLQNQFELYIINKGKLALKQYEELESKDPREYVDLLLEVYSKYNHFCSEMFSNDPIFFTSLDKAFRKIMNMCKNAPEILAKYSDCLLKKNNSKKLISKSMLSESHASFLNKFNNIDEDIDTLLNDLVILFKYLDDKDIFQKYYSRYLAKRLIYNTSISEDAEASMISKLKKACGLEYTIKLQKMIFDQQINIDLNKNYKDYLNSRFSVKENFHVLVLTAGAWPLPSNSDNEFKLPENLIRSLQNFEKYYYTKHTGRKISWLYSMFKGEIKVNYLNRSYDIYANLHMICLLLLFNNNNELNIQFLKDNIKVKEFTLIVQMLLDAKILIKKDGDASIEDPLTIICINNKFSSKRNKIKLQVPILHEKKETTDIQKEVQFDRNSYIQSLIVRIMKSRKKLQHTLLVNEVLNLAKNRFVPNIQDIKKNLDILIDKNYLEREVEDWNAYVYVA